MARKIETFPEGRRASRYPLGEWLDGDPWELVRGEDFEQTTTSMRSLLRTAAKQRGMRVRSRVQTDGDREVIFLQAHRNDVAEPGGDGEPREHRGGARRPRKATNGRDA